MQLQGRYHNQQLVDQQPVQQPQHLLDCSHRAQPLLCSAPRLGTSFEGLTSYFYFCVKNPISFLGSWRKSMAMMMRDFVGLNLYCFLIILG